METVLASASVSVTILPGRLPAQKLIRTHWFHTDCLAEYYRVPVFSEEHWTIIENFIRTAVRRGCTMILTPLFTPPLDTAPGGERLTVQLVDVNVCKGAYTFGFDRLERWVEICRRCGVAYLEMSHLFTQWGAAAAPKIIATVDGQEKRLFGWETDAHGEAYAHFLSEFLPALMEKLNELGVAERAYFHISDEPSLDHLESYRHACSLVKPYLQGRPVIDALSDFAFYQTGALEKPVVALDHLEPFLQAGVPGLWTYYCVGQYRDVTNSFMAMPAARTRMLGVQLYRYQLEGFLQWGYNFYHTQLSLANLNPYEVTDAGGVFPVGRRLSGLPRPGWKAGGIDSLHAESSGYAGSSGTGGTGDPAGPRTGAAAAGRMRPRPADPDRLSAGCRLLRPAAPAGEQRIERTAVNFFSIFNLFQSIHPKSPGSLR